MSKGGGGGGGTKNSGGVGGRSATTGSAKAKQAIQGFLKQGARGMAIQQTGMRPESLAHLRAGGKVLGGGIKVTIYPDGQAKITDGRHRITLAREQGTKTLDGTVQVMGPKGGIQATYDGPIKV